MYQLAHVVNTLLYKAKGVHKSISPMKIQKLVYFLYGEYLYREKEALFAERFEAWPYGPVIDDIYQSFKDYRDRPIRRYMPDATGDLRRIVLEDDPAFAYCFNTVWAKYGNKTGIELSKLTHDTRSAWYKAASNGRTFLSDSDIQKEMEWRIREQGTTARGQARF